MIFRFACAARRLGILVLGASLLGPSPVGGALAIAKEHDASHIAAEAPPAGAPALWKVADEDTTIYLFGTFHFLPAGLDWYTPRIAQALESADTVVMELGDAEGPAAMQQAVIVYGLLPADQSLSTLMTPNQNARLAERMAELEPQLSALGWNKEAFDRLQPWYAFLNLTIAKFMQMQFDPQTGAEAVLKQKAQGKGTLGLETLDYQFSLFASLSQAEQIALLMETVDGLDGVEEMLPQMAQAWAAGDADTVAELLNEDIDDTGLMEALLYTRNANWAQWIGERLESAPGTVFMAVGAGHLAGDRSVQAFLAARGIESERVQ